jgi:hypothetical protein
LPLLAQSHIAISVVVFFAPNLQFFPDEELLTRLEAASPWKWMGLEAASPWGRRRCRGKACVAVMHVYFGIIELCGPVWYNNGVVFAKPVNSRRGVP